MIIIIILICINSNCSIILIDRVFLFKQTLNVHIYIITSSISIREIDINYYSMNKYVLLKMYFSNKRNNKNIYAKITKKTYLIDDLKTKMLLKIDIIEFKKIDIIISKNQAYINSYDITIKIDLKSRSRNIIMKFVITNRSITMLFRS